MARQGQKGLAHPDDRNHKCRQEIRDADMRQPEKVRAHAENQDIADGTQRRRHNHDNDRIEHRLGKQLPL